MPYAQVYDRGFVVLCGASRSPSVSTVFFAKSSNDPAITDEPLTPNSGGLLNERLQGWNGHYLNQKLLCFNFLCKTYSFWVHSSSNTLCIRQKKLLIRQKFHSLQLVPFHFIHRYPFQAIGKSGYRTRTSPRVTRCAQKTGKALSSSLPDTSVPPNSKLLSISKFLINVSCVVWAQCFTINRGLNHAGREPSVLQQGYSPLLDPVQCIMFRNRPCCLCCVFTIEWQFASGSIVACKQRVRYC